MKPVIVVLILIVTIFTGCQNNSTEPQKPAGTSTQATPVTGSPSPSATPFDPSLLKPVVFTDVTNEAGIRFRHYNGAFGKKYLPETNGSGCAFIDYDNDGWQDIIFINSMSFDDDPKKRKSFHALYHNNQDGTFSDVTAKSGLTKQMYGQGVAVGDFDNDGWDDLFITAVGQNRLFKNTGKGSFTDVTAKFGLSGHQYFSSSAAFVDYDKDGRLDLFVCNYIDWTPAKDVFCALDGTSKSYCTPEKYEGQQSKLYRNTGNKFIDVTQKAGIIETPLGKSLGVSILDYNRDGWRDIFVANDTQPNKLFKNNRNGSFSEEGLIAGVALSEEGRARGGMGTDAADIDGSGLPSILVGNFSNDMLALFKNKGNGLFVDEAPSTNVGRETLTSLTFGAFFFDYDLDGRYDIFMANGHVADDINKVQPNITFAQRPQVFRNEGKRKFTEVTRRLGRPFNKAIVARGAAYADYDNDGDLDVLVTTNNGPAYLWRNDGGNQRRFIKFKLAGAKSNRNGIGAEIVVTPLGGGKIRRAVHSGSSYCSQSELILTFGLGGADKIESVEINWPGGTKQKFTDVEINHFYVVNESSGIIERKLLARDDLKIKP